MPTLVALPAINKYAAHVSSIHDGAYQMHTNLTPLNSMPAPFVTVAIRENQNRLDEIGEEKPSD